MNTAFLFRKTDIARLAVFRIGMGLLMAAEGFGAIATGWVRRNYVDPDFTFNFIGMDFLQILVGPQAYVIYSILGVLGLCIALGYRYKLAVLGYTVLWAAVYFGQKTSYNNHYYLLLFFCILLLIVPANRYASLDVRRQKISRSLVTPFWTIWVFKILLLIVYTFAALAKLYPDWLNGTVMRIFLRSKHDWFILEHLYDKDAFIYLVSYGGILFDLLVIPALWYKPTRKAAFGISIFFHLFNSIVFHIGIFPYMMLITSVLFFSPARIRRIFFRNSIAVSEEEYPADFQIKKGRVLGFIIPFFILMVALPLRPYYFDRSAHWTEEGHRLSWHMMLRSKYGSLFYTVKDKNSGQTYRIKPSDEMTEKQARSLATHPDMIWQYAQRIHKRYSQENKDVAVYAHSHAGLNGRRTKPLVDSKVDLASARWHYFGNNPWIVKHPELE